MCVFPDYICGNKKKQLMQLWKHGENTRALARIALGLDTGRCVPVGAA